MALDLSNDELLTTTRSVRKRLDFDRPVSRELLMECLDIALQAPSGSNAQGWQWIFVDDPDTKKALADIYRSNATGYLQLAPPERGDIRDQQQAAVRDSASYLNENFEKAPVLMIPFLFVMGALAGGVALIIPVFLKNRLKVDEVVTTLLLNFVILLLVGYLIEGPWKDPMSLGWPQAAPIVDEGVLPKLLARGRLHGGLIVALAMAVLVWIIMRYTVWGFDIRAVGQNDKAAEFAGIGIARTIVWSQLQMLNRAPRSLTVDAQPPTSLRASRSSTSRPATSDSTSRRISTLPEEEVPER